MLIEEKLLIRHGRSWTTGAGFETVRVPATIEALLATRLDQLASSSAPSSSARR